MDELSRLFECKYGFQPLPFADADRILQNVLQTCGYKEAHMKENWQNGNPSLWELVKL